MKERVTLTIEKDILEKVDKTVNHSDIKNRSHAVELMLIKAMGENQPRKAVILAGGHGRQTHPMLPNAMIRVQNKPLLEHNIMLLKKYGVKEIMISIGEGGEIIKEYFSDGKEWNLKITYMEEDEPLGTAGPLHNLKGQIDSSFLLLNADELKEIDLEDMFDFHHRNKGMITMALTTIEDPSQYGVAVMNGHKIMAFVEKPPKERAPSKLINAGLYILEPEVLKMVPVGFSLLEQDILPKLARQEKLMGYVFSGQWFDTRTEENLKVAERDWKGE
ncbi:nucleotidyltransferase family protein [Candidatus Woesearchaeota archaeon]|nr:nucleotidyltransferase family protein [Candidatus Woesearchaeota archaeon]